jgi:opacity protein-like surface antigen
MHYTLLLGFKIKEYLICFLKTKTKTKTKKKKMKKLLLGTIVTMFTLSSMQSTAQMKKGAYVGVNVGYSAAAGAANLEDLFNSSNPTTSNDYENIKFSFGKGVNAGLSFGYMFNENIGAELGVQYLIGDKTKYSRAINSGFIIFNTSGDMSAKMIQIKPSIVLATTIKNTTPYAKFGMVIGSGKITSNANTPLSPNISYAETRELKGGMAVGFTAAMGLNFSVSKNLFISGELNMINMQYSPKKSILTKYTENGVDRLSSLPVSAKEVEFVKKYSYNYLTPTVTTSPSQSPSYTTPFGSIGINLGLKYNF